MPKRTLDTTPTMATSKMPPGSPIKAQKTERSHEENQERAYIAASRRADRSLEARVQSAKMASEIHRRRTGRGLKVSEEIVLKEEMYEEEDDDLPRSYRYLTAHLQTGSPEMNHRVNAYLSTQAAMATMARYQEINRLFSESFPSAANMQQQMSNSVYAAPLGIPTHQSSEKSQADNNKPSSPSTASVSSPTVTEASRPSISEQSDASGTEADRRLSDATTIASPPAHSPDVAKSPMSPYQPTQQSATTFESSHIDPRLAQQPFSGSSSSIFTSELPNDAKMMAQVDMNDPMAAHFFGGSDPSTWSMPAAEPSLKTSGFDFDYNSAPTAELDNSPTDTIQPDNQSLFFSPVEESLDCFDFGGYNTAFNAPGGGGGGDGGGWESFVDFGSDQ